MPGLGIFYLKEIPAYIDQENNALVAPTQEIIFSGDQEEPSPAFYRYISLHEQVNEIAARDSLRAFSEKVRQDAATETGALLEGLGILREEAEGYFVFYPVERTELQPSLALSETLTRELSRAMQAENAADEVTQRPFDRHWWIYALALGLLGAGAVFYYYYTTA